jgi:hypothetical protein
MGFAFTKTFGHAATVAAFAVCGCSDDGGHAAGTSPVGLGGASGSAAFGMGGTSATPGSGGAATGGTTPIGQGGALSAGGTPVGGGGTPAGTGGTTQATTGSGGSSSGRTSATGGAGEMGGAGGMGGMSGGGGMGGAPPKPPCLSDASQLVMIGDSYVNWITHTFPQDMNDVSMLNIGDFAIGGTSMGSGGIGLIPPQFDTALMTHSKIIAVIMDGGGNDILVPDTTMFPHGADCKAMGAASPMIPDCQAIVKKALDAGQQLFIHMADNGVRDAIYFFYPHVPTGTWLAQDPNGMLDYSLPLIKAACDGAYDLSVKMDPTKPITCHFVDMVPVFDGHPEFFAMNDLHPNPMGSKAMAAAVWAKMKQDCVAQPASSGCCTPQ